MARFSMGAAIRMDGHRPGAAALPPSPAHAEVLTNHDSLAYLASLARFLARAGKHLDALREAYRTGCGVSWAALGEDLREAQGALNRPLFLHQLGQEYLPQIDDLHERLSRDGARGADVDCGLGGTVLRTRTLTEYATRAGFSRVEALPHLEHEFLRFYRMHR